MSPDAATASAINTTNAQLMQQFREQIGILGELQQKIQAKMPPPPMPPEIQASIKIAEMENNRKTQLDQATFGLKQQEAAAQRALEQAQFQLDQMQQQFDQALERQRLALVEQNDKLTAQVDLMNNRADNQQKQMTELLKNRDDNETKMQIEMQKGFEQLRAQLSQPQQVTQPLS